jgi:CMP-N,N'-diacetyllegionaminic acid synthase
MSIVGLITARGGSKGIPRKNIAACAGKPLLQYTCEAALGSKGMDRVILSTDSEEIARVGVSCGIDVPFMRPAALSADNTPSMEVMRHALDWLRSGDPQPEAIVLLQPTSPLRTATHIDAAIELFRTSQADTVVSVVEAPHRFHPLSVMKQIDGELRPYFGDRATVTRRQDLPPVYARNGPAVLIVTPAQIDAGDFYRGRVVGYLMNAHDSIDIDCEDDLRLAEYFLSRRAAEP